MKKPLLALLALAPLLAAAASFYPWKEEYNLWLPTVWTPTSVANASQLKTPSPVKAPLPLFALAPQPREIPLSTPSLITGNLAFFAAPETVAVRTSAHLTVAGTPAITLSLPEELSSLPVPITGILVVRAPVVNFIAAWPEGVTPEKAQQLSSLIKDTLLPLADGSYTVSVAP